MKLKLVFIGDDKSVRNFTYNGKVYRPYYLFGEKYSLNDLIPYLVSQNDPFNYKEFSEANTKIGNKPANIYACLSEGENSFYIPVSSNRICKFDMEKNNDTQVVQEQIQPQPIPSQYIIETKNPTIAKMMELRGCKILQEGKSYLIVEEAALNFTKDFRDEYIFNKNTVQTLKKIKTQTGYEEEIKITCNGTVFKGFKVYSMRNHKAYIIGNDLKNREVLFSEIWYDEKGDIETPYNPKDKKCKNLKHQSCRVYEPKLI